MLLQTHYLKEIFIKLKTTYRNPVKRNIYKIEDHLQKPSEKCWGNFPNTLHNLVSLSTERYTGAIQFPQNLSTNCLFYPWSDWQNLSFSDYNTTYLFIWSFLAIIYFTLIQPPPPIIPKYSSSAHMLMGIPPTHTHTPAAQVFSTTEHIGTHLVLRAWLWAHKCDKAKHIWAWDIGYTGTYHASCSFQIIWGWGQVRWKVIHPRGGNHRDPARSALLTCGLAAPAPLLQQLAMLRNSKTKHTCILFFFIIV